MYIRTHKIFGARTLKIYCSYTVAPIGEKIFAVLGEDRILYTPIDSDFGKNCAVRLIKGTGWNIKKIRPYKNKSGVIYTIPKSFAQTLSLRKEDYVLVIGKEDVLEVIPVNIIVSRIGKFKEPIL